VAGAGWYAHKIAWFKIAGGVVNLSLAGAFYEIEYLVIARVYLLPDLASRWDAHEHDLDIWPGRQDFAKVYVFLGLLWGVYDALHTRPSLLPS
jgi:hypothetical protein